MAVLVLGCFVARAAAAVDWSIEIAPAGEMFPVLDLSQAPAKRTAASGSGKGLVIVRVASRPDAEHVRIEVRTPGLRTPAIVEADSEPGRPLELRPELDWSIAYLQRLKAPRRQLLRVTLEPSGGPPETREVPVRVHPIDDALYYVRDGRDGIDLGWVFAAYVNPDDPVVDDVLASARAFDATFDEPAATPAARSRKALAVWAALVQHGLGYAAGDPALSRGPAVYSQRVRLLADVWNERRANCLDGSVLIASVLERIGIPAFIVLVPRHAFVGYRLDGIEDAAGGAAAHAEFLETTLLGQRAPAARPSADTTPVVANFEAARAAGRARWRRIAARFERPHGPDYALIDIGTARSYGIIPIGAHGDGGEGSARADPAAAARLPRRSSPQ